MSNGTLLREYEVTGRYYDSTQYEDQPLGQVLDSAEFSLRAVPKQTGQQTLAQSARLMFRLGTEDTEGGYAVFTQRNGYELLACLQYPPEPSDEIVRQSVTASGTYIDPWQPSPDTLSYSENVQSEVSVYIQPVHLMGDVGLRIQLDGTTTNTPYVDLTPTQYTDLANIVNEYLENWPQYRTAQNTTPDTVTGSGSEIETASTPPQQIPDSDPSNILEL